jgi:hypothetical protein
MTKMLTISLPAKPYIAAYAHHRWGEPIAINNQTALGAMAIALLQKKRFTTKLPHADKDFRFAHYTQKIFLTMPLGDIYRLGSQLSGEHILQLNSFLQASFTESLRIFVDTVCNHAQRTRGLETALCDFAAANNIEIDEHISLDGLKKLEYRSRTRNAAEAHLHAQRSVGTFWPVLSQN